MADFRKLVLALAVLALVVVPASAQSLTCTASVVPTTVRSEGLAELVGDTELVCEGGPAGTVIANIQVFLTTNITSRLVDGQINEAFLLVGDGLGVLPQPGGPAQVVDSPPFAATSNVLRGTRTANQSVVWNNVTIPAVAAGGTQRRLRITNIRANANQVGGNSNVPGQIIEFISISGPQGITLVNGNQTFIVAFVQPGLSFEVADGSGAISADVGDIFPACTGFNTGFDVDDPVTGTNGTGYTFGLEYSELFASAFKRIGDVPQNIPGNNYFTENAFVLVDDPEDAGQASQGTQVFARFANVPEGARIYVTIRPVSGAVDAVYVGSDETDFGDFPGSTITTPDSQGWQRVTLSGGSGTAVWEVLTADGNALESMTFGVAVVVPAAITITGTPTPFATVAGGYAPVNGTTTASSSAPIPRFVDTSTASDLFAINACVSNLLFPYVTNQGGFDTGIALVNTSLDNATGSSGSPANQPFRTATQHGTCTVYYFGEMGNGNAVTAPQTTIDIAAGKMVTFAISQGGVAGATSSAATFQGYIIARCNFQFAHGFAFVSDVGANRVSHGYLALVIPDRGTTSRAADPFTTAGSGSGEQLAY